MAKQNTRSQRVQKCSNRTLILPPNPDPWTASPKTDPLVTLTVKVRMSEFAEIQEYFTDRGYGLSDGIRAMVGHYMEQT